MIVNIDLMYYYTNPKILKIFSIFLIFLYLIVF